MFGTSTFCLKLFEGAKDNLLELIMLIYWMENYDLFKEKISSLMTQLSIFAHGYIQG